MIDSIYAFDYDVDYNVDFGMQKNRTMSIRHLTYQNTTGAPAIFFFKKQESRNFCPQKVGEKQDKKCKKQEKQVYKNGKNPAKQRKNKKNLIYYGLVAYILYTILSLNLKLSKNSMVSNILIKS